MGKIIGRNYSYWMLAPVVVLYLVFFIIPSVQGIGYSFTSWDAFTARFIGLENFKYILKNADLNVAFKNTFIFTVIATSLKSVFALTLAVILNQQLKTRNFLRTVYFTPCILNNVAVGLIFTAILHPETGILNRFFRVLGLDFIAMEWLTDTRLAIYSVTLIDVWKWTGFTMVILLAGLQSIPQEYYEASDIDGATAFQKFRIITLPLIMPAFNNSFMVNLIGGLKIFDIIYATTRGGPGSATEVLYTVVFKSYLNGRLGESSAANTMLAVIVAVISFIFYRVLRKKEIEL